MNNLEPVNSRKDYLSPDDSRHDSMAPRAKIGDRVGKAQLSPQEGVVKDLIRDVEIVQLFLEVVSDDHYDCETIKVNLKDTKKFCKHLAVIQKRSLDILKNLTTGKEYGNE